MKALLVASGINPPRTHDLEALVDLLSPAPLLPDDVEDALVYATELAVIPRYPVRSDLRSPGRADRARHELDRVIRAGADHLRMGYPAPAIAAPTDNWNSILMTVHPRAPPYLAATLQRGSQSGTPLASR